MDAIFSRDIMAALGMDINCILSEYWMFDRLRDTIDIDGEQLDIYKYVYRGIYITIQEL